MQEMEFDGIFDDDLFEDETLEEGQEEEVTQEETQDNEEVQEPQEEEVTQEPFVTVRYNKEDKNLTRDEAITLAQKGMNYDHIYSENQSLRELNNHIQSLANATGMEVEEYLNHLSTMQENFAVSQELNELKERYPEADEALLKELAQSNVSKARANKEQEQVTKAQKEEQSRAQETVRQVEMLERRYPEVDINKLVDNDTFMDYVAQGYSVLESYQLMKEDERAIIEKNAQKNSKNIENKSRSLGNITNSESDKADDFLQGFDNI